MKSNSVSKISYFLFFIFLHFVFFHFLIFPIFQCFSFLFFRVFFFSRFSQKMFSSFLRTPKKIVENSYCKNDDFLCESSIFGLRCKVTDTTSPFHLSFFFHISVVRKTGPTI